MVAFAKGGLVNKAREAQNAETQKRKLNIRVPLVTADAGSLSGGNQQKVVLAKWLSMKPSVIIFDEPTRGVDVGAKTEIYTLMRGLADSGVAILMISSDLEEVIGVSDRGRRHARGRHQRHSSARPPQRGDHHAACHRQPRSLKGRAC